MGLQYAHVILDLSAEAVDRLFTYSVPEGMILLPGQQVEVPFGPRRLEGFVVSLSDRTDLDLARVKPVLRALYIQENTVMAEMQEKEKLSTIPP